MTATYSKDTVFISGNFNVLHAGHIRLFAFAHGFGKRLIVGVISDDRAGSDAYIEESLRVEAVRTNSWVSEAVLINEDIENIIDKLRPAVVIKGKEFEYQENIEADAVSKYGGRLIFGSWELPLSSIDMMRREFASTRSPRFRLPKPFLKMHSITMESISELVNSFSDLRVCVLGDLIVDEYISCESLGMSQEDPSLVVTPIDRRKFLGGAAIVAAHASALGADSSLITVVGKDEGSEFAHQMLKNYGVSSFAFTDDSRPTTLKKRYRSEGKTLLRVSHLVQSSVNIRLQDIIFDQFIASIDEYDLIVFSDFNYGLLPNRLVEKCVSEASKRGIICVADSQCSSQVGDVSRFKGMSLISATEREVRISLRDADDGLTVMAERLRLQARANHVLVKLGGDGVLIHTSSGAGRVTTNQLPALNDKPVDVAGAGDSMLIAASMALTVGGSPWEASLIGSVASALQVNRLGNQPISRSDLLAAIDFDAPSVVL